MTAGTGRRAGGAGWRASGPIGAVALAAALASTTPALAHEPLWGETPTIFGPTVFHPEIRIGFLRRGGSPDPGEQSSEDIDQEYGLQYGINRFVNLRVTIPVMHMTIEENTAGTTEEALVSGVGDAMVAAKVRFHLHQETGFQTSQALVAGWKMPTGDDDRTDPGGGRLPPSDQPGSGRHGVELGWATDVERLVDSAWASVFYGHDFGGGFKRGDTLEVDMAYGRWIVRPNTSEDLGVNLAFGIHGEAAASDHLDDGASAENSYRIGGIQLTPILTKGNAQYRLGIFVPLARAGDDRRTDFPYEVRAGWEMFF